MFSVGRGWVFEQSVEMPQEKPKVVPILDSDAEYITEKYFYENLFVLPVIGAVFGFHHTRWWSIITYCLFTLYYTIVFSTILTNSYSSYLNRDNLSVFSGSLHITITGIVVLGASFSLQYLRKEMTEMITTYVLNENVCEYQKGEYYSNLRVAADKKIKSLLLFWISMYGSPATVAVTAPFIDEYFGNELPPTNGTVYWKVLPLTSWWPLDAHNTFIGWITCYLSQGSYAFVAAATAISGMVLFAICCENLFIHTKILIHSLENLESRAKAMFIKFYPGKSPKKLRDEYNECFYLCIVQNIKHHHGIQMQMRLIEYLSSVPLGVPFLGGALLLALAGINLLLHDDPRIGPKLFYSSLGVTEATQIFLFCHYGERIQNMSGELFDATFHTFCHRRSMKCKRAMMILKYGCAKPMKLVAVKLIVLNIDTFSNLVNSAYSIFNLRSVTAAGNKDSS